MKRLLASALLLSFIIGAASCKKDTDPSAVDLSGAFYSHGEDGYFSMLDEGYPVAIRDQGPPGACGAYASAATIERNIRYTLGDDFEVVPDDLIYDSVSMDKGEGVMLTSEHYATANSGPVDIEWATANGYNGYVLTAAPTFYGMPDDAVTREMIQSAIMTYGGVTADIQISTPRINGWHGGYYTLYDDGARLNHVVNILGWDDNFPAELFGDSVTSNGAWLVQNSFGEDWGNGGYCWVSYETHIKFFDTFQLSDEYSEVISHAPGAESSLGPITNATVGSVYDHTGSIGGVGTYLGWYFGDDGHMMITTSECSVTVEVRSADFSEVLYSQDATFPMGGYYVVEFDEPVEVDGEFAVVVTYHGDQVVPVEGASEEDYLAGMEMTYVTSCELGDSFILYDNEWRDLADPATSEYILTAMAEDGLLPYDLDSPEVQAAMSEPGTDPYINVLFV